MARSFEGGRVEIRVGDITTLRVDAIVNAANTSRTHGVDDVPRRQREAVGDLRLADRRPAEHLARVEELCGVQSG